MESYTERFIFALTPTERAALVALARQDGVSQSGTMRRLLRREARERGLWPVKGGVNSGYEEQRNENKP